MMCQSRKGIDAWEVDLASLNAPQLSSVKKQLDDELEHLTTSYTKLLAAQSRFRECLKSIEQGVSRNVIGNWESPA